MTMAQFEAYQESVGSGMLWGKSNREQHVLQVPGGQLKTKNVIEVSRRSASVVHLKQFHSTLDCSLHLCVRFEMFFRACLEL